LAGAIEQVILHGSFAMEEVVFFWRASFLRRKEARAAREQVLRWQPEKLLIAHGMCAQSGASAIVKNALSWI
jgi:hypothetical protein